VKDGELVDWRYHLGEDVYDTRSPWVRVNGMFKALVWSFDFDLHDISNEM
jgi:hypothetical protein